MAHPANFAPTTSDRLANVLAYGALLLLGYLVFRITKPFLVPLAWSAVLAIFFFPLHERLSRRLKPSAASLASTLAVTLLLIVPALVVLFFTAREGLEASSYLKSMFTPNAEWTARVVAWVRHLLPAAWQDVDFSEQLRQAGERIASFLAVRLTNLLRNLLSFFFDLFLLLFALFFMFRDGEGIVRVVRHLLPFDASIQEDMLRESRELIFASVAVALLIAAVQGVLGGIAFALVRLPTPFFWGVVIAFLSLVPVVGSALVWVPAALWLAFTGHWGKGIALVAICGGVSGVIDNLLRPMLLRNRTQLNSLLLFVSVLGGISVFGMLGLVAGPTIVAAAMAIFRVYMQHREPPAASTSA